MVKVQKLAICPACSTPLSRELRSEGLCPGCALELALEDSSVEAEVLVDPEEAPTLQYSGYAFEEGQIQGEGIVVYSSTDRGRKRSESMIFMAEGASQGAAVQLGVGGHARDVHVVQDESTDVGAMQGSDSLQYQYSELSAGLKKTADKVDSQHAKPCATLRRNECACVCVCL